MRGSGLVLTPHPLFPPPRTTLLVAFLLPGSIAPMKRSPHGASMFSRSRQLDLRGSELVAVAGDKIVGPTVKVEVNVGASLDPLRCNQTLGDLPLSDEGFPKRRIQGTDSPPSPPSKGAKWLPIPSWFLARSESQGPNTFNSTAAEQLTYDSDESDTPPLTRGSSCASSPFSSQEDLTLVGLTRAI